MNAIIEISGRAGERRETYRLPDPMYCGPLGRAIHAALREGDTCGVILAYGHKVRWAYRGPAGEADAT